MNSVIKKLSEIETTAEAIVEHAEAQKSEIEKKIQSARDQFDVDLEADTQQKLEAIRSEADAKMEHILAEQRQKNQVTIDELKKEYEENHVVYTEELLKKILEV